jgi:peptidoglycan/LPS O-acetylase OafA/YrhL
MLLLNKINNLVLPQTFTVAYPDGINLNGSLWSIKIEFECYILLALLGLCGVLRRRSLVLTLCMATFVLRALVGTPYFVEHLPMLGKLERFYWHLHLGLYFLIGAAFYLYRDRIPYDRRLFWGAAVLVALGAVTHTFNLVMPLCGSYLLFGAAFSQKPCWPNFAEKRDLSYGVYLYGWPIQLLLVTFLGKNLNPYVLFAIVLPLSCAAAALSWHLIEAPCLSLVRKRHSLSVPTAHPILPPMDMDATPAKVNHVIQAEPAGK